MDLTHGPQLLFPCSRCIAPPRWESSWQLLLSSRHTFESHPRSACREINPRPPKRCAPSQPCPRRRSTRPGSASSAQNNEPMAARFLPSWSRPAARGFSSTSLFSFQTSRVLTRPHNQNRIAGMAHDCLRYAAKHPALHAGAPVRTHGDQVIRRLSSQRNNLVPGETFLSHTRHLCNSQLFELGSLLVEIFTRFVAHAGDQFLVVPGVEALVTGVDVVRNVIGAEQLDLQVELLRQTGDHR